MLLLYQYLREQFRRANLFAVHRIDNYSFRPDFEQKLVCMKFHKFEKKGTITISPNRYNTYDIHIYVEEELKYLICGVKLNDIAAKVQELLLRL